MSVRYGAGAMHTNGPPSAGGPTLAQMLKVVSAYDLATMPEAEYVRVMSGAMKLALGDRETAYLDGAKNSRVAERLTGEEIRGGAAAQNLLRLRFAAHDASLVCGQRGPGRLDYGQHGLRVGTRRAGHGHPYEQHLGEPELNPRGFHALAPGSV